MSGLYDLNDVQQTLAIGNISFNRDDLIKFLLNWEELAFIFINLAGNFKRSINKC